MTRTSWRWSAVLVSLVGAAASAQPGRLPDARDFEPPVRFDGHRAVRVTVANLREYRTVMALTDDVLTCEGSGIGTFDVRMSPEHFGAFLRTGITHTVMVGDIQRHLDQIWADDAAVRAGGGAADDETWFVTYRSLAEIESRLATLAANFPTLATLSNVGPSVQGRQIKLMRITGPGSTTTRPAFLIHGNQHAREWVTPMSAMYIVDRLLETYATDSRVRAVVDNIDFYIIPCVNPDGYEYTRTTNAGWRKNRRDNPGTSCDGVDLNRNWGYQWGFDNTGSSGSTCSETYRGPSPFSEPELAPLKTLSDTLGSQGQGRLKVHWDIHANAQMLLACWGYTTTPPPDIALHNTLGQLMKDGMATVRGTQYPYGPGSVILYLNNGNARDYSYGVNGVSAWSIEMTGSSFQPALSQILPIAQEALAGLLPLAEYYIPAAPACYANCDASTASPVLNVADFTCFLARFAASDAYANCDASTAAPTLNVSDFTCFLQKYAAGCP